MPEQTTSMTVFDYEDRELLHILNDLSQKSDDDRWVATEELAEVLKVTLPAHRRNGFGRGKELDTQRHRYAMACIARRYSYMASAGWVERGDWGAKRVWRLTEVGSTLMNGKLTSSFEQALRGLGPGERVLLMRELTEAYRAVDSFERTMMRRQFQHGTHDRRTRRILR